MTSPLRFARAAGVLYLVIIVCGVGGEGLVRGPLTAATDAETVANLLAAELPFRLSILADVVMALADVALGALLYFLLKPVSHALSAMAMAFRLVQAAILGLNLVNLHGALALARSDLPAEQRDILVTAALDAHATGYDLGLFFFAINCLLVGALVFRAGFLPRGIGVGVAAAGLVYLVGSALRVVAPELSEAFAPAYAIPLIAELTFAGWLIVKGGSAPLLRRGIPVC
jgi:hypothetical protein